MVPVCDKRYHIYNRFRHFGAEIKKSNDGKDWHIAVNTSIDKPHSRSSLPERLNLSAVLLSVPQTWQKYVPFYTPVPNGSCHKCSMNLSIHRICLCMTRLLCYPCKSLCGYHFCLCKTNTKLIETFLIPVYWCAVAVLQLTKIRLFACFVFPHTHPTLSIRTGI